MAEPQNSSPGRISPINAVVTADFTDDRFVADIHMLSPRMVKTALLVSFCNDWYPCDLRNPWFFALRKLGSAQPSRTCDAPNSP
jgi:hypothetical protein